LKPSGRLQPSIPQASPQTQSCVTGVFPSLESVLRLTNLPNVVSSNRPSVSSVAPIPTLIRVARNAILRQRRLSTSSRVPLHLFVPSDPSSCKERMKAILSF
jgi:hypothetical protein